MKLRTKFIIAIGTILLTTYALLLLYFSKRQHDLIYGQALQQARMLHRQIVITRQWVADHHDLLVLRSDSAKPNPYLDSPVMHTESGRVYVRRNPAMVTRELSEYAARDGWCVFRVTSLQPINPENRPDHFERDALQRLENRREKEAVTIEQGASGRVLRYVAPLTVEESCLGCHARHGYAVGDIRGGLSIAIPIDWADAMIADNNRSIIFYGLLSTLLISAALVWLFSSLVSRPLARLTVAMDRYPEHSLPWYRPQQIPDETDALGTAFHELSRRLDSSREALQQAGKKAFQSEKMAALGLLTSGIAHEINNPLGGLLNCVKALREEPDNPDLLTRYLPLLDKGLRNIELTMRQLLRFGRSMPLEIRLQDVDQVIRECFELLAFRMQSIQVRMALGLQEKYCIDGEALRQIIINVGLNAIQALGEKEGTISVHSALADDCLKIRIEDDGPGIAPEILDRIFDPFFTTKGVGVGTGLGLAVSYSLAEKMGGSLIAGNREGRGAFFILTLPADQSCRLAAAVTQNGKRPGGL